VGRISDQPYPIDDPPTKQFARWPAIFSMRDPNLKEFFGHM
jgi:hypothetical protein